MKLCVGILVALALIASAVPVAAQRDRLGFGEALGAQIIRSQLRGEPVKPVEERRAVAPIAPTQDTLKTSEKIKVEKR